MKKNIPTDPEKQGISVYLRMCVSLVANIILAAFYIISQYYLYLNRKLNMSL